MVASSSLLSPVSSSSLNGLVRDKGDGSGLRPRGVLRPPLTDAGAVAVGEARSLPLEVDDTELVRERPSAVAKESVEPVPSHRPGPVSDEVVELCLEGSYGRAGNC